MLPHAAKALERVTDGERQHAARWAALFIGEVFRDSGPGANLVEAVGAVDRPVVAWKEWHECLPAALRADCGVHLALPTVTVLAAASDAKGAILLRDGSAALAALWLVHQPLAGVELLLAR